MSSKVLWRTLLAVTNGLPLVVPALFGTSVMPQPVEAQELDRQDQHLWVNDGNVGRFLKFDLDGQLQFNWSTFGHHPGQMWGVHAFSTDSEGNVYTAEVWGGRAQKFRPKPGADPAQLIGPITPLGP